MKIGVSHHTCDGDCGEWKCEKPLVFLLDDPAGKDVVKNEKQRKKQKKKSVPQITNKNFGTHLSISKIKDAEMLLLAWRCRFLDIFSKTRNFWEVTSDNFLFLINGLSLEKDHLGHLYFHPHAPRLDSSSSSSDGVKVITPIRPVMCLSQKMDLGETSVRILWSLTALSPCSGCFLMLAFEHAKQDGQARIQQAFDGLLSGFFYCISLDQNHWKNLRNLDWLTDFWIKALIPHIAPRIAFLQIAWSQPDWLSSRFGNVGSGVGPSHR